MTGLIEGRIVHFVDRHKTLSAALVSGIVDAAKGVATFTSLKIDSTADRLRARYPTMPLEAPLRGTGFHAEP